ncbi:hypothetical protein JR316_0001637 [Psilocybe cubensis]|uniref:EF-hand domain-containing protein n=2 Tax=Psilocybe cubensis TaxID=181762 RepID=A0A8H7Y746_PSICU|nr:hypothetical protein JR316_0001637 [Psilocybe cubensis]KAH9484737.1 hypothetical protein JR316_0001637 [Psilocybe cubensis]
MGPTYLTPNNFTSEPDEVHETLLVEAYTSTLSVPATGEKDDKRMNTLDSMESETDARWAWFHNFYEANAELIAARPRGITSESKNIEESMNTFSEAAQATVKGLQCLGQLHPFIGAAVGAFILVITLDVSRRENERKVLAVKFQMRDLMAVFFELRHFRHSNIAQGHDGVSIAERLKGLMTIIAKDVRSCASDCDAYLKKGLLARTVKATAYETRLAEYVTRFEEYRRKVELAFAMHTSLGVDVANDKLTGIESRLRSIEDRIQDTLALFRRLETVREHDLKKFIEEHGGVKACLSNDESLEELVLRSGEASSRISGRDTSRRSSDLPSIRKRLLKEVAEDIDEAFERNMVLFERKLEMQKRQMEDTVIHESDRVIQTLTAGAHDQILDPDLQKIWKDMSWKGSVKARHFVLALHDYYTDKLSKARKDSPIIEGTGLTSPLHRPPLRSPSSSAFKRQDDKWALAYINAAYVQPILEAVDDDGTGFVSVKEVNTFVKERPDGWSLPHWIAYWAVGWQASISMYKNKIYSLVQTMFQTLEHVLPSNRHAVDEYLFHESFWRIELLLRSTRSANHKVMQDPDLARITDAYATAEEERLQRNLNSVSFELDTPATVSLVTGEGRIERYIFPLLYLLLRRHLKIMMIACRHVIHTEELAAHSESLVSILLSIDYRIQSLEAVFKQTHLDVQGRLGNFAFGIFQLSYGDIKRAPIHNSFGSWVNDDESGSLDVEPLPLQCIKEKVATLPVSSILRYGIQDAYLATEYFEFEPARLARTAHAIQGTWTGHCSRTEGQDLITYILRLSFRMSPDHSVLIGKGEDFSSTFAFQGRVKQTDLGYDFYFVLTDDSSDLSKRGSGSYNISTDTIVMSWSDRRKKLHPEEPYYQPIHLRRTPPSLVRYRYTPDRFSEDPAKARWAFVCNAAIHQAQAKLWSRQFFEARFTERKRFVELTTRSLIVSMGLTPQNPLNVSESAELEYLRRELNPSEARFYHALAQFEIQKLPWHPSWGCDWCERRITKSRNLCIHCISEDLSDNIELCSVCIDKTPSKRGFTHDASHDIIKVEETLHDFYFAKVVESARTVVSRTKGIFRALESAGLHSDVNHTQRQDAEEAVSEPTCACCNKRVTTPCWACVVCVRDTYICIDCDSRRLRSSPEGPSPGHKLNHPLVRIQDSIVAGQHTSTEQVLSSLQQRVLSMEQKLTAGLAAIDAKVEERMSRLESRVEEQLASMQAKAELRFESMEALMRQMILQTASLPPISVAKSQGSRRPFGPRLTSPR